MEDLELTNKIKSVKSRIEKLITDGYLSQAKTVLDQYEGKLPGDPDICSMRAVIAIMEGNLDLAKQIISKGLENDSVNYDLLYNLAYIHELQLQYQQAADLYMKAGTAASTDEQKQNITASINRLKETDKTVEVKDKARIVFFVKAGLDGFLGDIIAGLSVEYWVRKIIVDDFKKIDEGMEWADICWFEWCDELVIYGSRLPLADTRKIICRLHSYEAFTDYISKVPWNRVDSVIFVAEHIRDFVLNKNKELSFEQTIIIPNPVDGNKYTFKKRSAGFNIAYVGYINYKKGPMLLLHTFKALYDLDNRYKLYIAGVFQDPRDELYFNQMIKEFNIQDNVLFDGWQNDIDNWLEDKNYILCTSILESQNMSVMQAMCKGIKPVVHNFVGAKNIYPKEYVWNTIDEAIDMIRSSNYCSYEYSAFINNNYSLKNIIEIIKKEININKSKTQNALKKLVDNINVPLIEINDFEYDLSYHHRISENSITIITPMYNSHSFLDELFKSVSEQTISKYVEWIIVNDCSTDNTLEKCIYLAKQHKNIGCIKVYTFHKNYGASSALKFGISQSTTDYIAWLSADDLYISSDKLEIDLNLLQSNKCDYVFSNIIYTGESSINGKFNVVNIDKAFVDIITGNNQFLKLAILTYVNSINGSSLVFKKELYNNSGGFDNALTNYDGDWDLHYKTLLCNGRFMIDNKCIFYRIHKNQTSANQIGMLLWTSLTRLRMLNTINEKGYLFDFIHAMKSYGMLNNKTFLKRPIFSYYLLKKSGLENTYKDFIYKIEKIYGINNLEKIYELSKTLNQSRSYQIFLKNFLIER